MNQNHFITIITLALTFFIGLQIMNHFRTKNSKPSGTIIILNGPSASGKTSIQKEFQKIMYQPYLAIGIDNFFVNPIPQHYMGGQPTEQNLPKEQVITGQFAKNAEGLPVFNLEFGPEGRKVIAGMHHAIAAYAQQGNNIIVDYILYDPAWLKELVNTLKDYKVYFVGIDIPLSTLEEREQARATSPVGHARSHYDSVHKPGIYDLRIDSSKTTPQEAAQQLKKFIEQHNDPQAFKKLQTLLH
jgi:chloramphenicol 3-O phosphotransferase